VEERLGLGAWGCGVQGVLTSRWGGGVLRSQNGLWGWLQKTDAYQFFLLWVEIKITMRVYLKNKWTWLLHGRDDLDCFTICRKLEDFSAKPPRPC
jgi:hypothetical protein